MTLLTRKIRWLLVLIFFMLALLIVCFQNHDRVSHFVATQMSGLKDETTGAQLGPRPSFLVNDMADSKLKTKLLQCAKGPFSSSQFSIGHRGAALQFPEHSKESYVAAAAMGAGIVECDVTFTKDKELVCRHSQCDLHRTTNILATPLAAQCSVPPEFNGAGHLINANEIQCCTTDITLAEFKTLKAKMDAANLTASSIEEYMNATANWRTDLYSANGTLMTHAESIELLDSLGVDFTPELKTPLVDMPFEGTYTQHDFANQMIDEYLQAGIDTDRIWPQSFEQKDVLHWIVEYPQLAHQVVHLDGRYDTSVSLQTMKQWRASGIHIIAPPIWVLLDVDHSGHMVPSQYALNAKQAGLEIITWSLERSGSLTDNGGWYFQSVNGDLGGDDVIDTDGDVYEVLDVLIKDVGVMGVFSDWPATVTYYANCMGLR